MFYLCIDCPKCGDYRVMPFVPEDKTKIGGHCMKCMHEFEVDKEIALEALRKFKKAQSGEK